MTGEFLRCTIAHTANLYFLSTFSVLTLTDIESLCHIVVKRWFIDYWNLPGELSRAELMMMTIADVIKQLVEAHEGGKDINLNK